MSEENTAEPQAEEEVEKETPQTDDGQTEGDVNIENNSDDEDIDLEKNQDESFYKTELARLKELEEKQEKLEKDLAEKERQVEIKNRALQAEKAKRRQKDEDSPPDKDWRDELRAEFDRRERVSDVKSELKRLTSSQAQYELALHHFNTAVSKISEGNTEQDALMAIALANAKRMPELLQRQLAEDEIDEKVAASMKSGTSSGFSTDVRLKSKARKEAEEILKSIDPKAVKHLNKYLPR
ncbi:MAG: hypothetical protein ABII13_05655 [Patescibacteria group bacterium]